jgi:bifunctional DNase/RNase
MTELYVMGIALDSRTGTPIVVLNDKENRRALPIWIGTAEASAIIRQLESIKTARPMTHDLLFNILETTGYSLTRVEINDLNSDTYYASLFLTHKDGHEQSIDSRPSDAIALALRAKAPIFATTNVMLEGTISTDQERDEEEAEAFKQFVQDVKPSDFKNFKFDRDIESNQ